MPLRSGSGGFFNPSLLSIYVFFSAVVVTAVIADSFAGERERHTLETLLASRLSDCAILFCKIAASIAYGWLISMLCVLSGAITVNVANWRGHALFYHDSASWLVLLLGPPLAGGTLATAGVLVSLHAATVRQAQQTLAVGFVVLFLGAFFGGDMLPTAWKVRFGGILVWSPVELVLAAAGVVLMIDLVLLLAGMARFQRAKLSTSSFATVPSLGLVGRGGGRCCPQGPPKPPFLIYVPARPPYGAVRAAGKQSFAGLLLSVLRAGKSETVDTGGFAPPGDHPRRASPPQMSRHTRSVSQSNGCRSILSWGRSELVLMSSCPLPKKMTVS